MRTFPFVLILALIVGCAISGWAEKATDGDILFQYSTFSALQAGVFDGDMSVGELKKHGDFGIGTFNGLDGEMVILDGTIYQVGTDGKPRPAGTDMKVPFAVATFFQSDRTVMIENGLDMAQLRDFMDKLLPSKNVFYAIKIIGEFPYLKLRSLSKQTHPYRKLAEVYKDQVIFDGNNVKGALVGFWIPTYATGINAMSYHFHFLSDDLSLGGHVLDCRVRGATAIIDEIPVFHLVLP